MLDSAQQAQAIPKIARKELCPTCYGTGRESTDDGYYRHSCYRCAGSGAVVVPEIPKAVDAFADGERAGKASRPLCLNPHPVGTFNRAEWSRGWLAGTANLVREDA